MSNPKKTVSIIISNHNYVEFLAAAIDSGLNQTFPLLEVVVVDDGSTDSSRDVVNSYGNQIKSVFKTNGGQASALNAGYAASQGEIICFLDSDDVFLPEKTSAIAKVFEENPEIGWCFHPLILEQANEIKNIDLRAVPYKPDGGYSKIDFIEAIRGASLPNFVPATSGLCFSRKVLDQIFPLPEMEGVCISDLYIKYLAIALAQGCVLEQPLAIQGIHSKNAYTRGSDRDKLRRLFSRINTFTAYYMRERFSFTRRLANKLFAKGLAVHLHAEGIHFRFNDARDHYLKQANFSEFWSIWLSTLVYYVKLFKRELV